MARNWLYATAGATGFSVVRVMVPLTRGSTTTLRPVSVAMVRATASMSALVKFSVIGSPRLADALTIGGGTTGAASWAQEFKEKRPPAPANSA
jgi:hypothetical protein